MMDSRLQETIHASIDRALDPAAEAELEARLEHDAEARAYRDRMVELNAFIDRIPHAEPPPGLHRRIMAEIRLPRPRRRLAFARLPGAVRYGFAAAAGLLLAVGIYEYRPQPGDAGDSSRMVGTVLPGRTSAVTLDEGGFSVDGKTGTVVLQRRDGSLVLDLQLEAPDGRVEVVVDYAGAAPVAFDSVSQAEGRVESIALDGQSVRILAGGHQKFSVVLDGAAARADGQIEVSWSSDGKLLKSEALSWSN